MKYTRSLIAAFLLILPLTMWAQDDMYFFSSKKAKKEAEKRKAEKQPKYEIIYADDDEPLDIVGSGRDVDEYNRRYSVSSRKGEAQLVQQPDGSFAYEIPQEDSVTVSTRSLLNNAYERGYDEGYMDGEDYALTRRMGRFGYSSVYVSPWYSTYYSDPFYWDSWYYWNDPFYYSWSRPYWGYSSYYYGYGPYHYGYGWNRPYYYGGWHHPYHYGGYRNYSYRGGRTSPHLDTRSRERYTINRSYGRSPHNNNIGGSSARDGQDGRIGSRGNSSSRRTVTPSTSSGSSSSRVATRSSSEGSNRSTNNNGGMVRGGSGSRGSSSSSSSSSGSFGGGSSRGSSGGGFSGGGSRGGGGGSRGGSGSRR